jgi:hypothetical protein
MIISFEHGNYHENKFTETGPRHKEVKGDNPDKIAWNL